MLTELFCTRLNQSLCGETESMSTTKPAACVPCSQYCYVLELLCGDWNWKYEFKICARLRACRAYSTVMCSTRISLRRNWKHEFKCKAACGPCSHWLNQSLCGEIGSMSATRLHACLAHRTVLCSNLFAAKLKICVSSCDAFSFRSVVLVLLGHAWRWQIHPSISACT